MRLTRGSLFFSTSMGPLKVGPLQEPLTARLRLGFYLGPTIERELEIYTFDTLRRMESRSQIAADGDALHNAAIEGQSPAEKLRAAAHRRKRDAAEEQELQRRTEALERAALDAGPIEFKALTELLRKRGESLNAEHLRGMPAIAFQPLNYRLAVGTTYAIELSARAQMSSFIASVRIELHPDAGQAHAELPRVETIACDFRAHVDESGFKWVDSQGTKWSSEQIIDTALDRLADLLSEEPEYGLNDY